MIKLRLKNIGHVLIPPVFLFFFTGSILVGQNIFTIKNDSNYNLDKITLSRTHPNYKQILVDINDSHASINNPLRPNESKKLDFSGLRKLTCQLDFEAIGHNRDNIHFSIRKSQVDICAQDEFRFTTQNAKFEGNYCANIIEQLSQIHVLLPEKSKVDEVVSMQVVNDATVHDVEYTWQLPNGQIESGSHIQFVFTEKGNFEIVLESHQIDCGYKTQKIKIQIQDQQKILRPILKYPSNKQVYDIMPEIKFLWDEVGDDAIYHFQLSDSNNFDAPIEKIINKGSIDMLQFKKAGIYFWRVKAEVGDLKSEWSDINTFEIRPLLVPIGVESILDRAFIRKATDLGADINLDIQKLEAKNLHGIIFLQWQPVAFAKEYEIQIVDTELHNNTLSFTSFVNIFSPSIDQGKTYEWRVRPKFTSGISDNNVGDWSATSLVKAERIPLNGESKKIKRTLVISTGTLGLLGGGAIVFFTKILLPDPPGRPNDNSQ